jgi:hypothetical protein
MVDWLLEAAIPYLIKHAHSIEIMIIGSEYGSTYDAHVLGIKTMIPSAFANADLCFVPQRYPEMTNELAMALQLHVPIITNEAGRTAIQHVSDGAENGNIVRRIRVANTISELLRVLHQPSAERPTYSRCMAQEQWQLSQLVHLLGVNAIGNQEAQIQKTYFQCGNSSPARSPICTFGRI